MDGITLALGAVAVLFILLVLRVPIAFSLLAVGIGGILVAGATRFGGFDLALGWRAVVSLLGRDPYSFVANFTLMAVPAFLLMGNLAFFSGATTDAYRTARVWLSGLPGGLAHASIVACGLFAAICGSSLACAAAMGRIAVPEMLKYGYQKGLASGVVAAGGTLGALIPPSILMIIYGIFSEQSIGQLLIGGIGPGILTLLLYMGYVHLRVTLNPSLAPQAAERYQWKDRVQSLGGTWQLMLVFGVVMGVIYTGAATPTEAAAIGVVAVMLLGLLRRRLTGKALWDCIKETGTQTAMIFAIAVASKVVVSFVALTGVSTALAEWAGSMEESRLLVLLGVCVIYLILGCFLDPIGIMLLTLPVVLPVIDAVGYNLVWFGVLVVKLLEVGMITPPVGLNVFVLKAAVGDSITLEQAFKGVIGFICTDFVIIALMIALPEIVMWLPGFMFE